MSNFYNLRIQYFRCCWTAVISGCSPRIQIIIKRILQNKFAASGMNSLFLSVFLSPFPISIWFNPAKRIKWNSIQFQTYSSHGNWIKICTPAYYAPCTNLGLVTMPEKFGTTTTGITKTFQEYSYLLISSNLQCF